MAADLQEIPSLLLITPKRLSPLSHGGGPTKYARRAIELAVADSLIDRKVV